MKKAKKRYRIAIEDESRLRQVASVSVSPGMLWVGGTAFALLMIFFTAVLIMATPVRTLLPGYLKKGERSEAKEGLLRIDSIRDAYRINNIYLSNILTVLDTDRTPTDSLLNVTTPNELPPDSLLPASPREIEFITRMKDREQYNVSILAPLAADQLRIYPVAAGATVSEQTTNPLKPRILTPKGSPVCAAADGRVLAIQNPAPEGGTAIVIQHDNGFASRYSHTGTPAVSPGTHVDGGSVIAHGATGGAVGSGYFFMEMWYDGNPVEPERYLGLDNDQ
ncbi:MAG: M23 family metallopeptidase [Muribaculaceae bacterium]|nr:M23 family metallopeptidase [Muribaculaceae bacterium]